MRKYIQVYVYMHGRQKRAGTIIDDTYYTFRTPNEFMIKYHGFCISYKLLEKLLIEGVKYIVIHYIGSKERIVYRTTIDKFLHSDYEYIYKGIDIQKCVPVDEMEVLFRIPIIHKEKQRTLLEFQ